MENGFRASFARLKLERSKVRLLLLCCFTLAFLFSQAQTASPFKLRYHTEQRGGIVYVANSSLTCEGYDLRVDELPKGKGNNNDYIMKYIDIDGLDETFNSSSADLNLPDCSYISFAGLYWGGIQSYSNTRFLNRNKVKLKLPGHEKYLDLVADESTGAQYFKNVTELIHSQNVMNGTYTVANVVADAGLKNTYAGWTLVIVYKQSLLPLKDLSVFDGMVNIGANSKLDFSISGFSSPPAGPVNLEFGFVAYDGDRDISGDYLAVNNHKVFDAYHDVNNFFNSSITNLGVPVTTRYPAYDNTLGYDASIIRLDNSDFKYMKNSDNQAFISLKTDGDGYPVGVITSAIDIYNPNLHLTHNYEILSNQSGLISAGDVIEMKYRIKNIGNDLSKRTVFTDTIPSLFTYEENSVEVQYNNGSWVKMTDTQGDDVATFNATNNAILLYLNNLNPESVLRVKYRIKLTDDVEKISCAGTLISKYAWLEYSGNVNSGWYNKVQSDPVGATDDCSLKGPLSFQIATPRLPVDTSINVYCSGTPIADLHLPVGYMIYKAGDLTYQHPLDKLGEPGVYKAYRKLSTGCEYSFNIIARADSVTIYSQPDNIEATVGSGVAFSVGVRGENVSFQWQVNKGDGSWEDIAGATERSLTIPKVTEEMDGYNYRLRITTPCKDYLLSVKVVLSVKKPVVSKPSEEPEPQPEVKDQNVGALFVPNAFMPASNTQELRSFVVKGHGLAKWQMTIFNKWDQVIWKTDVIGADGSPAEGWDGKMFGADAPQGAYMWAIEAVFEDGKEWEGMSVRDSKPRKNGVVYLLR